jgi:transcription termination/antitermination protein NusG
MTMSDEDKRQDEAAEAADDQTTPDVPVVEKRWYVVHTYSGFENKVKASLEQKIVTMNLHDDISEVLVPVENTVEIKKGKKQPVARKFYPGYILVYMRLTEETWHIVKSTPKVTGFVGPGQLPPPITDEEVGRIMGQMESGVAKPKPDAAYHVGDKVKVVEGPFASFVGEVDEVNADRSRLKVMISIFGRQTPVELDFDQVEQA